MKTISVDNCGPFPNGDIEFYLNLVRGCGGHYLQKTSASERSPLVGYAGKYDGPDGKKLQWVGREYVNFAMVEENPPILEFFVERLRTALFGGTDELLGQMRGTTGFCAAPEGGKAPALLLARLLRKRYLFPEKEVTKVKTDASREESKLVFDRHVPQKSDLLWLVEDVCNNFSTTAKMIELIESYGASVIGILCFLNRSPSVDNVFTIGDRALPVISVVRKIIPEYRQDDPAVIEDVQAGNVVWKPKNDWERLVAVMNQRD